MALYELGGGPSPDTGSAGTFVLDLPASKAVRNDFCGLQATTSMVFCYSSACELRWSPFLLNEPQKKTVCQRWDTLLVKGRHCGLSRDRPLA